VGCLFTTGALFGGISLPIDGILTGLLSGLGYALYSIFSRVALNKGYNSLTIIFYTFLFASVGVLPFINVADCIGAVSGARSAIWVLLLMAVVTTYLPYMLYTRGLAAVESGSASIMASIEPIVATLCGVFVLQQPMKIHEIVGALLVLCAIVMVNLKVGSNER
jgi:drug/metabolite transporter (DMT)-like permease